MSDLPSGWAAAEIGEIARIETGNTPPKGNAALYGREICFFKPGDLDAGGIVTRSEDMVSEAGAAVGRLLPTNSLLITCIGNLGKSALIGSPAICNQQINAVLPTPAAEPQYLYYWSRTIGPWLEENASATTVSIINKGRFSKTPITIAPLPEQRRIVAKIDSLSGKSRRARDHLDHIPRLIEKYKQTILTAAFRGELTSEPSELRTLGEISDIRSGFAFKSTEFRPVGDVPVIRIGDIAAGGSVVLSETSRYLPSRYLQEFSRFSVRAGDILVALSGATTGKSGVYNLKSPALLNQRIARLRTGEPFSAEARLLAHFVSWASDQILSASYGGAQPNISPQKLAAVPLKWPSQKGQEEVLQKLTMAFAWIERLAEEMRSARKLIDNLDQAVLAKAFRGELVPQDPNDEPASVLLERIRAERTAQPTRRRGRNVNVEIS
jgi:type I restriction enzyme, S subunit